MNSAAVHHATIQRAALVVPICSPPIEDGAVLLDGGVIRSLGKFHDVKRRAPLAASVVDHGPSSVILPRFVNCHCHLELSWAMGRIPEGLGFGKWLKRLMSLIHTEGVSQSDHERLGHIARGLELACGCGTGLVGDISNTPYDTQKIPSISSSLISNKPFIHNFLEIIHPETDVLALDPQILDAGDDRQFLLRRSFSAHSVYTCSRQALGAIKEDCSRRGYPFSIHVSESQEELEFVRSAKGPISAILESRGRDISRFFRCSTSPMSLLSEEGLLDDKTLCVHCVFVDDSDIDKVVETGAWVCLCPESNLFISGRLPPVDTFIKRGVKLCIGTDSLASGTNLSILSQLRTIFEAFPSVEPWRLVEAATLGGASALGLGERFGCIAPGRVGALLVLSDVDARAGEIYEFLCTEPVEERMKPVDT